MRLKRGFSGESPVRTRYLQALRRDVHVSEVEKASARRLSVGRRGSFGASKLLVRLDAFRRDVESHVSVGNEQQNLREFIDALRLTLGLAPLYRQLPETAPFTHWIGAGNRQTPKTRPPEGTSSARAFYNRAGYEFEREYRSGRLPK